MDAALGAGVLAVGPQIDQESGRRAGPLHGGHEPAAPVPPQDKEPVTPGTVKPAPSQETPRDVALVPVTSPGALKGDSVVKLLDLATDKLPQPSKGEEYDAALLDALGKMADRNYADARTALDKARAAQDTEQVRFEIEKVGEV